MKWAQAFIFFSFTLAFITTPVESNDSAIPATVESTETYYCTEAGGISTTARPCCAGLITEPESRICLDNSPQDPRLTTCTQHSQCSNGQGCLNKSSDDLFVNPSSDQEEAELLKKTLDLEKLLAEEALHPKETGSSCTKNIHCLSYNCSGSKCVEPSKICRLANDEDHDLPPQVMCEEGLTKKGAVCVVKEDPLPANFGLITEVHINQVPGQTCQFTIDDESRQFAEISMRSMRTMEWMLASMDAPDDCMKIIPFLKNSLKEEFMEKRKLILADFNMRMKYIENDIRTLKSTQDEEGMVMLHGQPLSKSIMVQRKASGYDMLLLMQEKNKVHQFYEKNMLELTHLMAEKILGLKKDMESWSDHSKKEWTLNGKHYDARGFNIGLDMYCRDGGFLGMGRRKIWKRWNQRIRFKANRENEEVLSSQNTKMTFKYILGKDPSDFIKYVSTPGLFKVNYLLDPLIKPDSALFKANMSPPMANLPRALQLQMQTFNNLKGLKRSIKESFKQHYVSLADENNDKDFIYEPELLDISVRGCLAGSTDKNCSKFDAHLDAISDMALAQTFFWSYHFRGDFKWYFNNSNSFRNRLMRHWEISLLNLDKYYTAMANYRNVQNNCLNKVTNQVAPNELDAKAGLQLDAKKYSDIKLDVPEKGLNSSKAAGKLIAEPGRHDYVLNTNKIVNNGGARTDVTPSQNSSSGQGSFNSSAISSQLAARHRELIKENNFALANGIDIPKTNKELRESLASQGGGGMAQNSAPRNNQNDINHNENTQETPSIATNAPINLEVKGEESQSGSIAAGNRPRFNELSENANPYLTEPEKVYNDPTGMSDEEKDVVMANYERNKRSYQADEEDNIFKVISKAYVRSLDKVLTKKKRPED